MYKRWKYIPEGRSEAEYPFYARRLATDGRGEQKGVRMNVGIIGEAACMIWRAFGRGEAGGEDAFW